MDGQTAQPLNGHVANARTQPKTMCLAHGVIQIEKADGGYFPHQRQQAVESQEI